MALRTFYNLLIRLVLAFWHSLGPERDPDMDESLAFYHERDPQENIDTTPPRDECIDLSCAWGVELYTPTHLAQLIEGFRKLGWRISDHPDSSRDPENWLYGLRRHQYGGAWMNLGYLISKGSSLPFIGAEMRVAPLPPCVKYASAGIHSISPSLVAVVVCFVFNDDVSGRFDNALRTDRRTFATPVQRGGYQIHHPSIQKTDHIRHIRVDFTRQIGTWFAEHLPGLFSSGILDHDIPTCEFITLRKAEPFPSNSEEGNCFQGYLRLLDLRLDFDVWKSSEIPGLKFRMQDFRERNPRYHSILAIKEDQHIDGMPDFYASADRYTRIAHVDRTIANLLSLWSILPMLEGYTQHLNMVRDSATFRLRDQLAPTKVLQEMGSNVAYSVDIAAVTAELAMYSEEGLPLVHDVAQFKPCDSQIYGSETSLRDRLEFMIHKQVTWLERTDKSIRDQLTQYGSLVGAAANISVQGRITRLTWALLFLAIATLAATVLTFLMQD